MQRKLLWSVVALVVSSTVICTYWQNRIARSSMSRSHVRHASILAQTLAGSLAGRMHTDARHEAIKLISSTLPDRRLAFVALLDEHGQLLHNRTRTVEAWSQYAQWQDRHGDIADRPVVLGADGELVVHKVPILNPPLGINDSDGVRALEGYVLLALNEDQMGLMIHELWLMQAAAASAICLISVPIVAWGVRRWTAPLRALLGATRRLGAGWAPRPIDATSDDELGALADSFNHMAHRLVQSQQALKHANEDLEQKVHRRTAELEQANRRLEAEMRDKDEFLRSVTHDLTAPLRNIDGMAGMLLKKYAEQLDEDIINKLRRITANARVQSELINDLMDLSRLRTRPTKREPVDLNALIEQLGADLSYDLESKGIELRVDGHLPDLLTDRIRIRQVFQNLLDNAIKYMGEGAGGRITVGWCDGEAPRFHVRDTGRGIDAKDLPHVFNVFRRGIYSGAQAQPGRGVGLAGVKAIVETLGGGVSVESEPGQGSTFSFTISRQHLCDATHAAA